VDNATPFAVGVDLGGSHLAVGMVSASGELHSFVREDVPRKSAWAVTRQIGKLVTRVCAENNVSPRCIGLGFPGLVNSLEGVVHQSPHFPAWQDAPIAALLSAQLDLPFFLQNDASMFAYAEARVGLGKSSSNFILLTLGSGIGAGVVLNGQLISGKYGFTGEVGHMTIDRTGPKCNCGNRGCWELFAASQAFAQYLLAFPREKKNFPVATQGLENVAQLAQTGSVAALSFWHWYAEQLAVGIHALMNIFGVTDFFLSGGIIKAEQFFLEETLLQVRARSYNSFAERISLQIATLKEQGGVIGAALYSLSKTT